MSVRQYEINENMVKFAPELASEYARYPMNQGRTWLQVSGKTPNKDPCFIHSMVDDGLKEDYVFGPGPRGFGYYHLLTKPSYAALYARMTRESPVPGCFWFLYSKERRRYFADYDEIERIVYARSRSKEPIDDCLKG